MGFGPHRCIYLTVLPRPAIPSPAMIFAGVRGHPFLLLFAVLSVLFSSSAGVRLSAGLSDSAHSLTQSASSTAVFALGSFWWSEAAFGCLPGVVRTSVGYAGGTVTNPLYRHLGDHAECVKIEYNPGTIQFSQLLDVFWASHDPRQVFGQGPDVGNQYRSIIFANGTEETRLAVTSKDREQAKDKSSVVTTQILPLGTFFPAEADHQKFELKRNALLLQLIGNLSEEELSASTLAAKLNGYAAQLCPPKTQKRIDRKIEDAIKNGWPLLRDI